MGQKIRKAVIPAAGLGTRFLPATKEIPKEMIPIIDRPMIQYIIEEAARAGMDEIILITAEGKESIEKHFSPNLELEAHLESKGKSDLLEIARSTGRLCKVTPILQDQPLGLGHAVLCAEEAVGDEPFAILLGDDLIDSDVPCTKQLADLFERTGKSCVGVMEVPQADVSKYGVVGGKALDPQTTEVTHLVEKPQPDVAPSRLAIPGRYVLSSKIFTYLRETKPGAGGEIQLTDALDQLAKNEGLLAYQFEGDRYDTGDRLGYLDATLTFGLRRPELREGLKKIIEKHSN